MTRVGRSAPVCGWAMVMPSLRHVFEDSASSVERGLSAEVHRHESVVRRHLLAARISSIVSAMVLGRFGRPARSAR